MNTTTHFGVYGLWKEDDQLVLIRKARGPYTGLLDLPGGSPETNETDNQTLGRELEEECGVTLSSILRQEPFTIHVDRSNAGDPINLIHSGLIKKVKVTGKVKNIRAFEDVAAVELFDSRHHSTDEFSPLIREALRLFPEFRIP